MDPLPWRSSCKRCAGGADRLALDFSRGIAIPLKGDTDGAPAPASLPRFRGVFAAEFRRELGLDRCLPVGLLVVAPLPGLTLA